MIKKWSPYFPVLIAVISIGLYANTFNNDYTFNDQLVTNNHSLTSQGISAIPEILNSYYYQDEMGYQYDYRPITHISFAIEHQFFNESATTSHIINVLLYALLAIFIYYLSLQITKNDKIWALLITLFFVFLPNHTEVVASIKSRDEILALLFGVLSLLTIIKATKSNEIGFKVLFFTLSILFFWGSVFSKLSGVPLLIYVPVFFFFYSQLSFIHIIYAFYGSITVSKQLFNNTNEEILFIVGLNIAVLIIYLIQLLKASMIGVKVGLKAKKKFFFLKFMLVLFIGFVLMFKFNSFGIQKILNANSSVVEIITENDTNKEFSRPILFHENPLIDNWDLEHRLATATYSTAFYLKKLLIPYPMLFYYGYKKIEIVNFSSIKFYISLFILVLYGICILIGLYYNKKVIALGMLFFLFFIAAYSNFLTPIAGIVGDRLSFFASLGIAIVLGSVAYLFIKKIGFKGVMLFVFALFMVYASLIFKRNFEWKNNETLFSHDIQHLKHSAVANSMLGELYVNKANSYTNPEQTERLDAINKSIHYFNQATSTYNQFHNDYYHLGIAYYLKGDFMNAQDAFIQSYAIDSTYDPLPYYNMAKWAMDIRQDSIAIYNLEQYVLLADYDEKAHFELLKLYFDTRENMKGFYLLLEMQKRFPQQLLVYYNLYETSNSLGFDSIADYYYQLGIQLDEFGMNSLLMP